MNLVKTLRENGRTLLMVFMALLLVAFLIPQSLEGCGSQRRDMLIQFGRAFGRDVTSVEVQRARDELQVLMSAGIIDPRSAPSDVDYHLLKSEAAQMGIRVGRAEVIDLLRRAGFTDEAVAAIQLRNSISYNQLFDMIGNWLAVMRVRSLQAAACLTSLPREMLSYRDQSQEAVALLSQINSKAFESSVPEPTEEQLQAFFAEGKDRMTAHTADALVFGYKLPDRVKIEYLTVDPDKIKSRVVVKGAQVERYFADNAARYTKPDPTAPPSSDGSPPPQIPMTFEEARDRVREELRDVRAVEEAQRVINNIYAEAHRPWVLAERDPNTGFARAPAGELPTFEDFQRKYAADGVEYYKTELVDQATLQATAGFGQARLPERQSLSAAQLAFRVEGLFVPDPQEDRLSVISVGEPAPVVLSGRFDFQARRMVPRQAFVFRVLEVAPSAPPASLDEVREQVKADWKTFEAHRMAREWAEKLAARAREVGLEAAVREATELREKLAAAETAATQAPGASPIPPRWAAALDPITPSQLTRGKQFIEQVGAAGPVAAALFELADKSPAGPPAQAERVAVVGLANQYKWVVGELVEVKPIYEGGFQAQVASASLRNRMTAMQRFDFEWAAPQNLYQRIGFVAAEPRARR